MSFLIASHFESLFVLLQHIPDSPYMLESVIDHIKEEHSSDVKLQLLTATMKLFFKRPAECQEMLGRLLQYCVGKGCIE